MGRRWWQFAMAGTALVAAVLLAVRGRAGDGGDGSGPPFRLGLVQAEDLQVTVREVGVVDPATKVDVKAATSGRVVAIRVREGAPVRRGQVLAEVEPDVTQAQSLSAVTGALARAQVRFRHADDACRRAAALNREGVLPEADFLAAKARRDEAGEALRSAQAGYRIVEDRGIPIGGAADTQVARVTAPMDGVVIRRGAEPGDTITSGVSSFNAGTVLFTVADLSSLIIKVNLNEVDIAKVQVGQAAVVTLDAHPQKTFSGRVQFVAPAAEAVDKLKVFKVELALDRQDPAFRTGMSANVEILGERRGQAVSVPLEALQRRDGRVVVYRLRAGLPAKALAAAREGLSGRSKHVWLSDHWRDYFEVVPVQAGLATLERVEIRSGLAREDRVCLEDPSRRQVEKDDEL